MIAAITLFSTFAFFSLWLFPKRAPKGTTVPVETEKEANQKAWRNSIYYFCGVGILASMGWAVFERMSGRPSIFWPESIALGFFAWSWLAKGRVVRSITSTLGAAKAKLAS